MGRIFECSPGRHAWNLEKCEEELLIAAYDEIMRFIPANQVWKAEFEYYFFERGNGLAFDSLSFMNSVRRRHSLDAIVIRETIIYDYARTTARLLKARHRQKVREELNSASADVRRDRLEQAKAESEKLRPPRTTYEEWKHEQRQNTRSGLTSQEVANRLVVEKSVLQEPTLQPDLAVKMLTLASPSIWDEILPKLSAAGALEAAEKIDNVELRDALIKYSFKAACSFNAG